MDKIEKALNKLGKKERKTVRTLLYRLSKGDYQGVDIQKLKSRQDIYRARNGDIRVIYRRSNSDILVLAIERRSEKTYRNFWKIP